MTRELIICDKSVNQVKLQFWHCQECFKFPLISLDCLEFLSISVAVPYQMWNSLLQILGSGSVLHIGVSVLLSG